MSKPLFEVFSTCESTPLLVTERSRVLLSQKPVMRPFRGEDGEYLPFRYHSFKENLMVLGMMQFGVCLIVFCILAMIGNNLPVGFIMVSPVGLGGIISFTFSAVLKHSLAYSVIEENVRRIQKLNVIFMLVMVIMLVIPIQVLTVAFSLNPFSGAEKFFLSILSGFSMFLIFIPICSVWGTLLPYKYV
ncbi:hypothetical protein BV898_05095 [Hypsibius exemplaris]|uniref:Uncharacterized protein n=1 Tax=Hypsibius exemplaris TaxID=2072580 RepID=A0A1W0X156_HYPEX|nr:hypothetical protein BV898_05095 [Hypsibius exemplaris]